MWQTFALAGSACAGGVTCAQPAKARASNPCRKVHFTPFLLILHDIPRCQNPFSPQFLTASLRDLLVLAKFIHSGSPQDNLTRSCSFDTAGELPTGR
jgi:hypothetical protein